MTGYDARELYPHWMTGAGGRPHSVGDTSSKPLLMAVPGCRLRGYGVR